MSGVTPPPPTAIAVARVYNARAYGVIGDGATDDTAAANAFLQLVRSVGGGVAYFPAGTYRFNGTVGVTPAMFADTSLAYDPSPPTLRNVRILGDADGGAFGGNGGNLTIFDFYGTGSGLVLGNAYANYGDGIEVAHIRIRGRNTAGEPATAPQTGTLSGPAITVKGVNYYQVSGSSGFTLKLKITATGIIGAAKFQYSLDGGSTYNGTDIVTYTDTGGDVHEYRIGPLDLTASLPSGTYTNDSVYTFTIPQGEITVASPTTGPTIHVYGEAYWSGNCSIKITTGGTGGGGGSPVAQWSLSVNGGPYEAMGVITNATGGYRVAGDLALVPETFHTTGLTVYFPTGTYVLNDVYSFTMTPPAYNNIGAQFVGTSNAHIHHCTITGFKHGFSFEGTDSNRAEHVYASANESVGYPDVQTNLGEFSASGGRMIRGASPVVQSANQNVIDHCTFSSWFGSIHDDGVAHRVRACNYECIGAAAFVNGGIGISWADCTGEAMRKATIWCSRSASSGLSGGGSNLSVKSCFIFPHADLPGILIESGSSLNGIVLDNVNIGSSPSGVVIGSVEDVFQNGPVARTAGRPIVASAETRSAIGATINHNSEPQAGLDVALVDISQPMLRLKSGNSFRATLLDIGFDSVTRKAKGFTKVLSSSGADWRAAALWYEEAQLIAQSAAAADFAAIDIPGDGFAGIAKVAVVAAGNADPSKNFYAVYSRAFYRASGVLHWQETLQTDRAPLDTDGGAFVAPSLEISGTTIVVRQAGNTSRDCNFAFFHSIESSGF